MVHSPFTMPALLGALVWPGLFAIGAACASIPIIIHLLARRRFRRVRWAAIEFLLDAQRRNQRRVRLEEWILLALRCLAMLLIALIVARFFLRPKGLAQVLSGGGRTEHILLIDDSFSTTYQLDDQTRVFDRARQAARRIVENIQHEASEDTVTVVALTHPDAPLVAGASTDAQQAERVLAQIAGLSATQQTFPAAAVQSVRDYLDAHPDILNAAIYVISDFQATDWVAMPPASAPPGASPSSAAGDASRPAPIAAGAADDAPPAGPQHLLSPLRDWAGKERMLRVVLVSVAASEAPNLAISEAAFASGLPVVGTPARLRVAVSNFSDAPVQNLEVRAVIGESLTFTQTLSNVAPGQSASVEIEATFPSAGDESVRFEIPHDRLELDDVAYAAAEVLNAVRVLVVNGEPSADAFDDEVHLLEAALRPAGEVFSGNEVTVIDAAALDTADVLRYHAVILANVPALTDAAAASLTRFVQGGGGVIVFLGDQVDPDAWNQRLFADGRGILPARLEPAVSFSQEPRRLIVAHPSHPVLEGFAREGDPLGLGHVRFTGFMPCEAGAAAPTQEEEDQAPSSAASRVLATFDDEERRPVLIEKLVGDGRVLLVATSADKEWSTWPDSPTFLPLCLEMVAHVARRGAAAASVRVGEPLTLTVENGAFDTSAFLHTPAYPAQAEIPLAGLAVDEGRGLRFAFDRTTRAGVYRFLLRSAEDREETRLAAVNVDADESDLMPARPEELRKAMPDVPLEYVADLEQLQRLAPESRTELWAACLVAALAVLMLEQTLAWTFGRRAVTRAASTGGAERRPWTSRRASGAQPPSSRIAARHSPGGGTA